MRAARVHSRSRIEAILQQSQARLALCALLPLLPLLIGLAACSSRPPSDPREKPTAPDQMVDADRRARVRLELAAAYFGRGQYDTALEEVKLSLAANPDNSGAYNLRGLIYGTLGDQALAEDSFRRALQINARDADAAHNYGWFLCQQQRYPDALAQFQQALAQPMYREVPRTLLARGICQARAGQLMEAEGSLMRAFELEPANPSAALNLSEVLLRRGEFERARFYVSRVNAQPLATNAQSLWLATRIEHRAGNAQRAREFGEQLRVRFPDAPETQRLQQGRFDD